MLRLRTLDGFEFWGHNTFFPVPAAKKLLLCPQIPPQNRIGQLRPIVDTSSMTRSN